MGGIVHSRVKNSVQPDLPPSGSSDKNVESSTASSDAPMNPSSESVVPGTINRSDDGPTVPSTEIAVPLNNINETDSANTHQHVEHETGLLYRDSVINSSNFFAAVKQGNMNSVVQLINDCPDAGKLVASEGMWASTPLIIACQYCHKEIAVLLAGKCSTEVINHVNEKGASALLYACLEDGMAEVVQLLLYRGATVNTTPSPVYHSKFDKTLSLCCLSAVILGNGVDSASLILDHYPFSSDPVRFDAAFGKGILIVSGFASTASSGSGTSSSSSNVSRPLTKGSGSTHLSPMMLACSYGALEVAQKLLVHRSKTGARTIDIAGHFCTHVDNIGCNVFHHVCKGIGNEKTLLELLDLLISACYTGSTDAGDTGDVENSSNVKTNDSGCSNELVESAINAMDVGGNTPLHYACDNKYTLLVERLINLRKVPDSRTSDATFICNRNISNSNGVTPLYVAIKRRCEVAVSALLQQEVTHSSCGDSTRTETGMFTEIADPRITDCNGVSCIDLAKKLRADSVIQVAVMTVMEKLVPAGVSHESNSAPQELNSAAGDTSVTASKVEEVIPPTKTGTEYSNPAVAMGGIHESGAAGNDMGLPVPSQLAPVPAAPTSKNTSFIRHSSKTKLVPMSSLDDSAVTPLSRKNTASSTLAPLDPNSVLPYSPAVKTSSTPIAIADSTCSSHNRSQEPNVQGCEEDNCPVGTYKSDINDSLVITEL